MRVLSKREHIIGESVSATIPEIITAKDKAKANSLTWYE